MFYCSEKISENSRAVSVFSRPCWCDFIGDLLQVDSNSMVRWMVALWMTNLMSCFGENENIDTAYPELSLHWEFFGCRRLDNRASRNILRGSCSSLFFVFQSEKHLMVLAW